MLPERILSALSVVTDIHTHAEPLVRSDVGCGSLSGGTILIIALVSSHNALGKYLLNQAHNILLPPHQRLHKIL